MNDKWTTRLSAYLDGELSTDERAALERHLETCGDCRATLQQLHRVVEWADGYEGREPGPNAWSQISAAIGDTPSGVVKLERRRKPQRPTISLRQAFAAAVALAVAGAGGWWLARATAPNRMAQVIDMSGPTDVGVSVVATIEVAQTYGPAIADLERVVQQERDALDSTTVRVLQEQLVIIDRALAEARAALAQDPASDFLADHYAAMMKKKLSVLRAATRSLAES
jgi:anti-sigma factor RsiW